MLKQNKIGIIGFGFVGDAIHNSMAAMSIYDLVVIDPFKGQTGSYPDVVDADGVFVCVPTPMGDDGSCDTSALDDVLAKLKAINYTGVIISKCTMPPTNYTAYQKDFPNLVHAPEFLTAANARADYGNGKFAIIGGAVSAYRNEAERIIKMGQIDLQSIVHCTIEEASLAKYTINSFLATKVAFFNEIYQLCEQAGIHYDTVRQLVSLDQRIGKSHTQVPGPDGQLGFGGACFPKDTSALLKYSESIGQNLNILDSAVKKNSLLRLTDLNKKL
jgi:UDPglucose 6-dehydrogenase